MTKLLEFGGLTHNTEKPYQFVRKFSHKSLSLVEVLSITMLMNSFKNYLIALTTPSSQAYFTTMNYNAIDYKFILGYGFSFRPPIVNFLFPVTHPHCNFRAACIFIITFDDHVIEFLLFPPCC